MHHPHEFAGLLYSLRHRRHVEPIKLRQTTIELPRVTDKTCSRIQETLLLVDSNLRCPSQQYVTVVDVGRNEAMDERSR